MHSEQLCANARPFGAKIVIWCRKLDFGKNGYSFWRKDVQQAKRV
jgi:hypothetical protein